MRSSLVRIRRLGAADGITTVLDDGPVNQFVAGFIGSPAMNLQAAPLTKDGARLAA